MIKVKGKLFVDSVKMTPYSQEEIYLS